MKADVCHIFMNVSNPVRSFPFYKKLLGYFEYRVEFENEEYLGLTNGTSEIWLQQTSPDYRGKSFHRKQTGINHIAFRVSSKNEVDEFYKDFLQPKAINVLYDTPKPYPETTENYYSVYFEDPDRIKLEVCYY